MNRLEREVLEELEDDSYEFNEDKAVAIVALVREAIEQEIADAQESVEEEIDVIEQMVIQLSGSATAVTNTLSATGASIVTNPYATIVVGAGNHVISAPTNGITFKRQVSAYTSSNPVITSQMDSLRQHIFISCSCGWALTVSTSITDYPAIISKDINEHGKHAHGIDFNY